VSSREARPELQLARTDQQRQNNDSIVLQRRAVHLVGQPPQGSTGLQTFRLHNCAHLAPEIGILAPKRQYQQAGQQQRLAPVGSPFVVANLRQSIEHSGEPSIGVWAQKVWRAHACSKSLGHPPPGAPTNPTTPRRRSKIP